MADKEIKKSLSSRSGLLDARSVPRTKVRGLSNTSTSKISNHPFLIEEMRKNG